MPSNKLTRRRLLAAATVGVSGTLAGCTGDQRSADDQESANHHASESTDRPAEPSDDHESITIRADDTTPFVYQNEDRIPDDTDQAWARSTFHLVDEADADDLVLEVSDAETERVETFLEETDFEAESILVDQRTIDDCYDRFLLATDASADRTDLEYCRTLKPPEESCEPDYEVLEAIFVRLERPYDDAPSGRSSSESMTCPEGVVEADREETNESNVSNAVGRPATLETEAGR